MGFSKFPAMRFLWIWIGIGTLAGAEPAMLPPDPEEAAYPAIGRFVEVLEAVRKRHPDVDRLAYERLINHALEGMLAGLDPHSSFIHPEMAARMKESPEMNPDLPSLGMTLGLRDDGPYIAAAAPAGPASNAGLLPGSAVLEIDGKPMAGVDFPQLLESLRRPAGSVTKIRFKSPANAQAEEVTLAHRAVEERSVAKAIILDPQTGAGYVRLAVFGPGCAAEMEAALDELEDSGMKSLMLDLRGNGGGDLGETVKILGLWLPPETVAVTTRGRDPAATESLKTPERQRRKRDYPITVLIDRMSASASELTAGTLQDLKRARIIGEKSYGKGSVQNIIPMGGGTALRLTIATYHTPSGNTPHRKGITPDVLVEMSDKDRANFEKSCRVDSLTPEDRKELELWEDPVIRAAK
jgi:carboxyl-terminal processing protease